MYTDFMELHALKAYVDRMKNERRRPLNSQRYTTFLQCASKWCHAHALFLNAGM